jgi:ankyrin repeat protein
MKLTEAEVRELQTKYRYLTNFEAEDPTAPIDPLTYVDSNGDSLLHVATQRGDKRTIELLLQAGVDVNRPGDMGNTALHYARTGDIAQVLLSHGASTEVLNEFGKTPSLKG